MNKPLTNRPLITSDLPKPDGIRDTIESIVVAFILAFVFRAFVVEAFVIPTGSMAPGLYGKHVQHRCGLCNYPFAYGVRESARNPITGQVQDGTLESSGGYFVRCPNCGWTGAGNSNLNRSPDERLVGDSGDRILVLKWPYDIGGELLGPKRWDVVVFKDPQDGDTNFIKRLVGLPGEVLEIIDGDIYTAPCSALPADILEALAKPPPTGNPQFRRLSPGQEAKLNKALTIQRKTRVAEDSLWMIHYDHDYKPDLGRPQDQFNFNPPVWRPRNPEADPDWDASTPLVKFVPRSDREEWLELGGRPIQDNYGYNDVGIIPQGVFVGDVRLKFVLFPGEFASSKSPEAEARLTLLLRRGDDEFQLKLNPSGGDADARLERIGQRGIRRELARAKIEPFQIGRPINVEFENLDYRVTLRLDGQEVLATKDFDYSPDIPRLLQQRDGEKDQATVMIGARNLSLQIRHLAVHRDVFYRSERSEGTALEEYNVNHRRANPYARYPGWGTANHPIYLRNDPREHFCCGDNSPQSKDSRLWSEACPILEQRQDYQLGTVPADQMIGRAFFVYWPSGYRFSKDTYGVIPNVGRMRIIR